MRNNDNLRLQGADCLRELTGKNGDARTTISEGGILLIDKQAGESSFDVVRKVRRALGAGKKLKVGHAGTLDPFATGLLILMIGQGTKLAPFLTAGEKIYQGRIRLGVETDTLDPEGKVVQQATVPALKREQLEAVAGIFTGSIEQRPPDFSAVKDRGQRAYLRARRGEKPQLKTRRIFVRSLEIVAIHPDGFSLGACCSSGTYMRSLAADLARELGSVGHLAELRRLGSGPWRVEQALPSAEIPKTRQPAALAERIVPLAGALPEIPAVEISKRMVTRIWQGQRPRKKDLPLPAQGVEGRLRVLHAGRLVAVAAIGQRKGDRDEDIILERVFNATGHVA